MRKTYVAYIAVAANSNEQDTNVTTNDTNKAQQVKGVHVGITTKGFTLFLKVAGQEMTRVDCSFFSAGNGFLPLDFTIPAQQPIVVGLQDTSGTGNTQVPVTLIYDVAG